MLDLEYLDNGIGYDARAQLSAIPPAYLTKFQALKFRRGIPISWLAAVCSRTGYNPAYRTASARSCNIDGKITTTIRQFGLAGIWADIPEIEMTVERCGGGWASLKPSGPAGCQVWFDCTCPIADPLGQITLRQANIPLYYMDVDKNLEVATDILLNQAAIVTNLCGRVTDALFYRWQLGCKLPAECQILNLPDIFKSEPNTLLQLQRALAVELNEEPIGGVGCEPPVGGCPTGTHWVGSPTCNCIPDGGGGGDNTWLLLGGLGLLGLLGLVGLVGKGEKGQGKAAEARRKRQEANKLRMQAGQARAKGDVKRAQQLESRAMQLDAEATKLEQEAMRESAKAYERRR